MELTMKKVIGVFVFSTAVMFASALSEAAVLQSSTTGQFAVDATGIPLNTINFVDGISSGIVNGNSYSPDVVFSSGASLFGGVNSPNVNDTALEMGPVGGYDGQLIMNFVAELSAISFGSYQFNSNETISLFDNNSLLFSGFASGLAFDGLVGTGGTKFDKVVLDGSFYSLANVNYGFANVSAVPVPAALPLLLTGLGGLVGAARSRRRKQKVA